MSPEYIQIGVSLLGLAVTILVSWVGLKIRDGQLQTERKLMSAIGDVKDTQARVKEELTEHHDQTATLLHVHIAEDEQKFSQIAQWREEFKQSITELKMMVLSLGGPRR